MSSYDYVIVGAGSAGCVLANRLSEDPAVSVLVIEAGGADRSPKIKIPAAFSEQFRTKLDWAYETDPEPGCDDRRLFVPRGRSLGGSSSMNAMLYVRGCAADYDGWASDGCEGWSWRDVLPYFKRSENREGPGAEAHGTGGPLNVADAVSPRGLTALMIEAARANDYPLDPDYNDGEPDGVCRVQVNQKNGRRWSAADAFLRPARKRPNLTILPRATVLGIELRSGRATGVRYATGRSGSTAIAEASREVILAAGAIGSPQLLQVSGIGASEDLAAVGIEQRVELDGVGKNLQDHPYVVGIWESAVGQSLYDAQKPRAAAEFLLRRTGPLTSTVAEAFLWTRFDREATAPDLQFHLAPAYFADNGFEEFEGHAFTLGPVLVSPRSRGRVTVRSANPAVKPSILGNHLTDPFDIAALVEGVKLARRLVATEPLAAATAREIYPGPAVGDTDEAIEADVRRRCQLLYHPVGTCRMGTDDEAVVDPELRVRGVESLRVVDASVMPTITRGNTHAPTVMIAEKAADLIRSGAGVPA
jgi:choline dehydrogenase